MLPSAATRGLSLAESTTTVLFYIPLKGNGSLQATADALAWSKEACLICLGFKTDLLFMFWRLFCKTLL